MEQVSVRDAKAVAKTGLSKAVLSAAAQATAQFVMAKVKFE